MFTRSQYAALLLAASLVATPVVADSTILLNSNRVVKHKVSSTVTPLTTVPNSKITHFAGLINAASSVSPVTTAVATQTAALEKNIVISTASTGEELPKAVPLGNATPGGISAPLKKKKKETSAAKRNLDTRAQTSNFNSTIVDSWLMVLSVGTPPQQLELSLDLGSDGFVVESTLVTPDMQTVDYPIYNPNTSTTGKQIDGYSWGVTYGGFSLEGVVFTDVVTLGENTWTNMTMEVVTAEPTGSPIESASGILGLAAHLITGANPAYVPSFLGSIMNQLSDVVFTIWFNSTDFTDGTDPDGSIDFGFIDETKYTGDIAYAPLYNAAATTFWSLNVSGIGAADPVTGDLLYSNMTGFTAILDTGDPQSQLPLAALWGYYGAIPGSIFDDGGYCWDYVCTVNTGLPDLVLFIDDKPIVVPRATYAWWQNMNPSNGVPGVEYCTTHLRPSDYFNGGVNMIGQDIIEGIFLVLDWQNQQIGFANSTVKNTDSSFSIPGQGPTTSTTATSAASTSAAPTPSASTCSYTTSNVTINPFIKGCTGEEFGGTCYQIEVNNAGCTSLDSSLNLTSIQPNEDSNLRCTFYSGTQCGTELSDAIDVMYPGVSALSQSPGSAFCISTGVEPATEEGALLAYCGDGVDIGSGCFLSGQNPWSCSIMFAPSDQFKFNMSYLYSWTAPVGNCFFFQDEYCATLVSNTTGVDMCTSDKIGNGYQTAVNFTSYVGSAMCI